ncbi:hypothetical protein ILUMI_14370 [Ignelater luminosus]|uniref:HTH psq-type domain-containing protein n=1 Tax=Ignelater luminosus TaxID=2038154 RepID=A0A8K0CQJ9_IGNLU|nr:hypothetical protein ILUMI_14370 [Ignelater luminosus]
MRIAADKVLTKQVTIRKAAEIYNVPFTSLQRRVTFSRSIVKNRGGQQTVNRDTEMKLANRLTYLAGRGFGITPKLFEIWERRARINSMKKEKVAEFYKTLEKVVEENDLRGESECVYNINETEMPLNNQPPNIIAKKGSKNVVSMTSVEQGQNVTVLACVRKRHDFMIGMSSGTEVAMTEKGWVTEEAFKSFEIELVLSLQPLDVSFFKPLKAYYHQQTTAWQHSHTNMGITKVAFGGLFKQAWNQAARVGNTTKGFEKSGIFPLNANAILDHKFIGDTLDQDGNTPESNTEQQLDGTLFSVDAEQVDDAQPSTTHQRLEDTQSPTCSKQLANERSDSIDVKNAIR